MSQYVVTTPEGKHFGPTDFQTLVQWAREGRVLPGMTVDDLLSGQKMEAASVPGLFAEAGEYAVEAPVAPRDTSNAALVVGLIGLVAWCLPIAGLPIGFAAIVLGAKSLKTEGRTKGLVAIILGVTCILFSIVWTIVAKAILDSLGK